MSETQDTEWGLPPGYEVVEILPGHSIIKVPSGHTLKIRRLPPFLGSLTDVPELADPGPFKITIRLLEKARPPGVEQEILYQPPTDSEGKIVEPDRNDPDQEQAWMFFQQWRLHEHHRQELQLQRGQKRWELILARCIEILDGPSMPGDSEWVEDIRSFADVPEDPTLRRIMFLKVCVIYPEITRRVIERLIYVEEVTIEGVKRAFDTFRSYLWGRSSIPGLG